MALFNKNIGLYIAALVNILYMHYYILFTCKLEETTDILLWIDNLLGAIIDVNFILAAILLLSWGRLRASILITAIITLIWAFCNVIYSRFFHQYISLSAISQIGIVADSFMIKNVLGGIRWTDIIFLFQLILICKYYRSSGKIHNKIVAFHLLISIPTCIVIADFLLHVLFCISTPGMAYISYFMKRQYIRHIDMLHCSAMPNWTSFHRGFIRQELVPALYQHISSTNLTIEQCKAIKNEFMNHQDRISENNPKQTNKNVIFIIVESYLSITSDLIVDNKAVTPFLNKLRHDDSVYFNGHLNPNISIGESSDGQFIYMTGLLPLRSGITVSKAKKRSLPGLPTILKQEGIINEAQMIIPTLPSMWEQDVMCQKYGFDKLFSSVDYQNGKYTYMNDQQVFDFALQNIITIQQPFLSVILTMTMHQPYTEPIDSTYIVNDHLLTEKYRNYLSACHYTDRQIQCFFNQLKQHGLYDNSIIIIVADHQAHPSFFDMQEDDIPKDIPLFIVNGTISSDIGWEGKCNQLDVYTTILDILGVANTWRGFGHTLKTKNYHNSVKSSIWQMSEQIIVGNYFNKNLINE